MANPEPPSLSVPQAQHFLNLLEEVSVIQDFLLAESARLRARVRELEARCDGGRPA